jgi:hypothetical protein
MAGLDPAIQAPWPNRKGGCLDARIKSAHDEGVDASLRFVRNDEIAQWLLAQFGGDDPVRIAHRLAALDRVDILHA